MTTVQEIIERAKQAQGSLAGGESVAAEAAGDGPHFSVMEGPANSPPASEQTLEEAWPFLALDKCGIATHLSASSLTMYHRCREQFRRRYILGHKEPPKEFFLWGDADDKTFGHNFQLKIKSGEDLPSKELQEIFATKVDEIVEENGGPDEYPSWTDPKKKHGHVKDAGAPLVAAYRIKAAPMVHPLAVQKRIDVFVDDVPVPVIGYVDISEEKNILERKTAASKWSKPAGHYLVQGRIYQLAERKPVHWHLSTKTKTPGVYTPLDLEGLADPFLEENTQKTEDWIRHTVQAILSDFFRFGPDNPWPGARWTSQPPCFNVCGFRDSCEWWR